MNQQPLSSGNLSLFLYNTNANSEYLFNCEHLIKIINKYDLSISNGFFEENRNSNTFKFKELKIAENNNKKYRTVEPIELTQRIIDCIDKEIENNNNEELISLKKDVEFRQEEFLLEQERINYEFVTIDEKYNSVFSKEIDSDKKEKSDIVWKSLTLIQKAAIVGEFINEHPDIDAELYIKEINRNPEIINTKENKNILENIPPKNLALFYNAVQVHYEYLLDPKLYKTEIYFKNNNPDIKKEFLLETQFSNSKQALIDYTELTKKHYDNFILGEVRENNINNKILYETSKERTVDYENNIYIGKIDSNELKRIYNLEKTSTAEEAGDVVFKKILDYIESRKYTVYELQHKKNKKTLFTITNTSNNVSGTKDLEGVLKLVSSLTVNDRIKQLQENKNSKDKLLFKNENCEVIDELSNIADKLIDNFKNGKSKEYLRNENKLKELKSQVDYLSINHVTFRNTYNSINNNQILNKEKELKQDITDEQKKEIEKYADEKSKQYKKLNKILNNNSSKKY